MAWLNLQFDPSSENGLHTRCCQQQGIYTRCYKKSSGRMKVINHHTTWKDCVQVDTLTQYEKSYLLKPQNLTTKVSNQLIYNYIKLDNGNLKF
jgi:hypothetical protein